MPIKPPTSYGFPARIRIPRQRSVVHVLVKNGMPCDEFVEVIIPAKTIGMRDKICSANAGPAAPRAPSLSDALGTSRLPDTSSPQTQKGGGTFNTLTGNAIAR